MIPAVVVTVFSLKIYEKSQRSIVCQKIFFFLIILLIPYVKQRIQKNKSKLENFLVYMKN